MNHERDYADNKRSKEKLETSNIDRQRRKAKSVLKTIPDKYRAGSYEQSPSAKKKASATQLAAKNTLDAQEAYQTTIDEAGEYDLNKTTIDALKDGAVKMKGLGAHSHSISSTKIPDNTFH